MTPPVRDNVDRIEDRSRGLKECEDQGLCTRREVKGILSGESQRILRLQYAR